VVVHICIFNTQETVAGGLQVSGQPGLHRKTLSLKKILKKERKINTNLGGKQGIGCSLHKALPCQH
jgi:hypothetical protein